jgi:predicted RNA-binding protein with TRAM domain
MYDLSDKQKDLIVENQQFGREKSFSMFFAKDGEDLFRSDEGSSMGGSAPAAPVEAGKEYDVEIQDIAREGDGIARVEGFVIFVPEAKVGDRTKIQVDKVMRRFAIGHKV